MTAVCVLDSRYSCGYTRKTAAVRRQLDHARVEATMVNLQPTELVALGGAIGAGIMKFLDILLSRRKTDLDAANARMAAVNEANAQLVQSLFEHIKTLKGEVADMRLSLLECDEHHKKSQEEISRLRHELVSLRNTLKIN